MPKTTRGDIEVLTGSSDDELRIRKSFFDLYTNCPIPKEELLSNLGLFINRQTLSRILFIHELYKKILDVHGIIIEFGVRWGQNLVLFNQFRGIYEPYNYNRKIIGFDTFLGYPSTNAKDGNSKIIKVGAYNVTKGYESYLKRVLDYHEKECPLSHIRKNGLFKGDATITIDKYLSENPETIISLAYFDFDLYEPTKKCLEAITNHLTKGSIIGFDELNYHEFPGETLALKEVLGLSKYKITRSNLNPLTSYIVIE